jgi:hypothetical protein
MAGISRAMIRLFQKLILQLVIFVPNFTEKGSMGIISYIEDETKDFLKAYQVLKREMEPLKRHP